jgi:hypothetical protein
MKNLVSTAIIVAAIALLVPNNAAEAVVTHLLSPPVAVNSFAARAGTSMMSAVDSEAPDPSVAWLISLGFLGLIVMRRLRGE